VHTGNVVIALFGNVNPSLFWNEVWWISLGLNHPGGNPGANLKSISHRCHPILGAFVWGLTQEIIHLPLGCLQGGEARDAAAQTGCRGWGSGFRISGLGFRVWSLGLRV